MRTKLLTLVGMAIIASWCQAATASLPNIVVILTDDKDDQTA